MKTPCWNCHDRKAKCSVGCEAWKEYEAKRNAEYEHRVDPAHNYIRDTKIANKKKSVAMKSKISRGYKI